MCIAVDILHSTWRYFSQSLLHTRTASTHDTSSIVSLRYDTCRIQSMLSESGDEVSCRTLSCQTSCLHKCKESLTNDNFFVDISHYNSQLLLALTFDLSASSKKKPACHTLSLISFLSMHLAQKSRAVAVSD